MRTAGRNLFVANDTQPNKLYRNNHRRHFSATWQSRQAWRSAKMARRGAGMGVDAGDFEKLGVSGGLLSPTFDDEMMGLYRGSARGVYADIAATTPGGTDFAKEPRVRVFFSSTQISTAGWICLVVKRATSTIPYGNIRPDVRYEQPPHLFVSAGTKRFFTMRPQAVGSRFSPNRKWGGGAAYGDFDNDGDPDVLITTKPWSGSVISERIRPGAGGIGYVFELAGVESNRERDRGDGADFITAAAIVSRVVKKRIELLVLSRSCR